MNAVSPSLYLILEDVLPSTRDRDRTPSTDYGREIYRQDSITSIMPSFSKTDQGTDPKYLTRFTSRSCYSLLLACFYPKSLTSNINLTTTHATMRLSFAPLLALLTLVHAVPNPISPDDELSKRACTPLSYAKCHGSAGSSGGVYCGWCAQVLGTDWAVDDHV
jgi:hypothetical protein